MGPIWGRQDPGGPNVGPMNLAIWDTILFTVSKVMTPTSTYWVVHIVIILHVLNGLKKHEDVLGFSDIIRQWQIYINVDKHGCECYALVYKSINACTCAFIRVVYMFLWVWIYPYPVILLGCKCHAWAYESISAYICGLIRVVYLSPCVCIYLYPVILFVCSISFLSNNSYLFALSDNCTAVFDINQYQFISFTNYLLKS